MKPIRIFRHIVCEPPSYLCDYLSTHKLPFEVICLDEGMKVPDTIDDVSALIFMGGAGSVNDDKHWIHQELELIKHSDMNKLPVLGVCFGAQLISKALGGIVNECKTLEVGWHEIDCIKNNNTNVWLNGIPDQFFAFQWHAHTFSIPEGACGLWRSSCCEHQGFVKHNMLAMQFHLEVTEQSVIELTKRYAEDLSHSSDCVQTVTQIADHLKRRVGQLHVVADNIYNRWLTMSGLI